jgi:hypothetical protein
VSRGRPRHQSSRRRMYSPRQRDLRERRLHQQLDDVQAVEQVGTAEVDDGIEFESPSGWGIGLSARASAA